MRYHFPIVFITMLLTGYTLHKYNENPWILVLKQDGQSDIEITAIPKTLSHPVIIEKDVEHIHIKVALTPKSNYVAFISTASVDSGNAQLYLSLVKKYSDEVPYNFNGAVEKPEIFRQSPHDINAWIVNDIAMQAVPVIALKKDSLFEVALNGSPALYDNFTSQAFYTNAKQVELSSGDNGQTPGLHPDTTTPLNTTYNKEKTQVFAPGKITKGYHQVTKMHPHIFEGILFDCTATSLQGLRKEINQRAANYFSKGKYTDYFGALSFTTAYMNVRKNETGKSNYWVVPSVEYANTQYGRDAFWISMMLPPDMAAECLKNELDSVNHYAEYPLFTILWAYRTKMQKFNVDLFKVQQYVDAIEAHAKYGYFYSFDENDGRQDFQYWGDLIAFDKDDVITYNQGLFVLALKAAQKMGLKIKTDPAKALQLYQNLYNAKTGFYPISKKKNTIVGPDPLLPDLLSQLYFHRSLLPSDKVLNHYNFLIKHLKTPYGFKSLAQQNGAYLTNEQYDVKNYISQANKSNLSDGQYLRGGSYFLYDELFLIDAYLHGIKRAKDVLIWRTSLDFSIGATTYECLNTISGEPWKPNMGWNVAVYSVWRKLMDEGRASDKLLKHIDSLSHFSKN